LTEYAVRWAQNVNNKFAYKINLFYLRANDWEATNLSPVFDSESPANNPGGFNAVNRYGDEQRLTDGGDFKFFPGLKSFHRPGIEERFLVDYNTENIKASTTLHYRIQPDLELSYGFFFGTGTTVYQGENRFSLKDILFFQNKIQLERKNKWFVRAYSTNEDAGNSYDAYFTALRMQERVLATTGGQSSFDGYYKSDWTFSHRNNILALPGWPSQSDPRYQERADSVYALNIPFFDSLHQSTQNFINNAFIKDSLTPGTSAYNALFNAISQASFTEGGSRLIDRSALYHAMGQYRFDSTSIGVFTLGGNYRLYVPNSEGTIFSDTNGRRISVYEYGVFGGYDTYMVDKRLKLSLTARLDKNQNFDYLVSPAASVVYQINDLNTVRFSFSAAVRNPTLQDQFLYYNVGPAILLGNLNGYQGVFRDSLGNIDQNRGLVTIDDLENFLAAIDKTNYEFNFFDIDPVRPERVRTAEVGYRTTLFDKLFVDANYYYSWYRDFIGFLLVADIERNANLPGILQRVQPYRVSTNSEKQVTTQGFSIGMNYYFGKYYSLSGNYTWNVLNTESDDPIIPAFNTPEHKYNVSFIGREIPLDARKRYMWGYNMTWRWIQGFFFEGSPQFTGPIDDYGMVDAQTSLRVPKWNTTFKVGGSNILNNKVYTVYGGPLIGRMLYASITFDWLNNNE
jgi:outer membrane receptor protein involved in Fe transport